MASKKSSKKRSSHAQPGLKRPVSIKDPCICGGNCHEPHARLPGYLLMALGAMAVPLNFGLFPQLGWAKAWPLVLVLFGFVMIVRTVVCQRKTKG